MVQSQSFTAIHGTVSELVCVCVHVYVYELALQAAIESFKSRNVEPCACMSFDSDHNFRAHITCEKESWNGIDMYQP